MGELALFIVLLVAFYGVLFFIVKAAVAEGVKDAMQELVVRVNLRGTVKEGVLEALQEMEKDKTGGNNG